MDNDKDAKRKLVKNILEMLNKQSYINDIKVKTDSELKSIKTAYIIHDSLILKT